jgi:hypothetical protein
MERTLRLPESAKYSVPPPSTRIVPENVLTMPPKRAALGPPSANPDAQGVAPER